MQWAERIFCVVDPRTTDGSDSVAREYTDWVVTHEYRNAADQRNWAIPQIETEWTLVLDADEWVSPALRQRIAFHEHEEARWNRVSEIVEKQIGDWLRTASFVSRLVTGTLENIKEIDKTIYGQSEGWKLDRLVSVDHNILRLGCFELLYLPDRVSAVTINEAVELAKKYSTAESGSFVNGVLGALLSKPSAVSPQSPLAQEAESEAEQDTIDLPDEIMELEEETE